MDKNYALLSVSPEASDGEIEAAYRQLREKYAPGKYEDALLAERAEEKGRTLDEAYEAVMRERRKNRESPGKGYKAVLGFSVQRRSFSPNERYGVIRGHIRELRYQEALAVLEKFSEETRGAEWHFLMGCALKEKGYFVDSQRYFELACSMDSENTEYRSAIKGGGRKKVSPEAGDVCCECCCEGCASGCCEACCEGIGDGC